MNQQEYEEKVRELGLELQLESHEADRYRARSLTIGNIGCGEVEINMHGRTGNYLWNNYHPAEVIEFIHQLAAAVGCYAEVHPRKDFASWREWRELTEEELEQLSGWPPFAQIVNNGQNIGTGVLRHDRKFKKFDQVKQEEKEYVAVDKSE